MPQLELKENGHILFSGVHFQEPAVQQLEAQVPLAEPCRTSPPQLPLHVRPQETRHGRRMSAGTSVIKLFCRSNVKCWFDNLTFC